MLNRGVMGTWHEVQAKWTLSTEPPLRKACAAIAEPVPNGTKLRINRSSKMA